MEQQPGSLGDEAGHGEVAPLSLAEERRAIDAALEALAGRRLRVYGAELGVGKGPGWPPRRLATVLVADLDGYTPHEVVVDLEKGSIVEATERPELVIPFSEDEQREAIVLAQSQPGIAEAV